MLETILFTVAVLVVLCAGMAVGVIFMNKPIKGSCGGLAALGFKEGCDICGGDRSKCEESSQTESSRQKAVSLARDALKH